MSYGINYREGVGCMAQFIAPDGSKIQIWRKLQHKDNSELDKINDVAKKLEEYCKILLPSTTDKAIERYDWMMDSLSDHAV